MVASKALSVCWAMMLLLLPAIPASAIVLDFEDLAQASYNVGGAFSSNGIQFDVVAYNGPGFTFHVNKSGMPTNTRLFAGNSIGVDVAVPANVNYLAFDFYDSCSGCSTTGITVNGAASSPLVQLVDLNNTVLGGANVSILPASLPGFNARLVLEGAISTFVIGGTELAIDNLAMRVPEPSAAAAALLALGTVASWRRKR